MKGTGRKKRLALAHSCEDYARSMFVQLLRDRSRLGKDGLVSRSIVALRILLCFYENSNRRRKISATQIKEIVFAEMQWNYQPEILDPSISHLVKLGCLTEVKEPDWVKRYGLTETGNFLAAFVHEMKNADPEAHPEACTFAGQCFARSIRPNH